MCAYVHFEGWVGHACSGTLVKVNRTAFKSWLPTLIVWVLRIELKLLGIELKLQEPLLTHLAISLTLC